ncbi:velvet factor-domain-containing protein [Thelephora terrestris]|uniref:Velvet factor-domain-containing protein n=1 Tax=Thelephora terrestris TaxID=56493 RepID=A0A9P6HI76_9AGAM|nr:velvet factor-domain-containing protein [Thelephora terrestris]
MSSSSHRIHDTKSPLSPRQPKPSHPLHSPPNGSRLRPPLLYDLEIVQQPQKAAECGSLSLSRLPLAPPLIVQLSIRDGSGNVIPEEGELSFLIAHLSLIPVTESGGHSSTHTKPSDHTNQLYGSLVSSPQTFRDLHGRQGAYFLFPDVSVRIRGRFQLGVTLIELPGSVFKFGSDTRSQLGTF